jgi:TPR repeat protein
MAIDNYNAGMNAYDAGRFEEAKEWFEKGEESDPRCLYALAVQYYNGKGVEKNFKQSTHYYTLAADAGIPQAMTSAGFAYANCLGVPEDFEKAVKYLKMAVEHKEFAAQITLAELYAKGIGGGSRKEAADMIREVLQYGNDDEAMDVYSRYELHLA